MFFIFILQIRTYIKHSYKSTFYFHSCTSYVSRVYALKNALFIYKCLKYFFFRYSNDLSLKIENSFYVEMS